jgi:hypothetical protein
MQFRLFVELEQLEPPEITYELTKRATFFSDISLRGLGLIPVGGKSSPTQPCAPALIMQLFEHFYLLWLFQRYVV